MTRGELVKRVAERLKNGGPCPAEVIVGAPGDAACERGCGTREEWRSCWATAIVDLVESVKEDGEKHGS